LKWLAFKKKIINLIPAFTNFCGFLNFFLKCYYFNSFTKFYKNPENLGFYVFLFRKFFKKNPFRRVKLFSRSTVVKRQFFFLKKTLKKNKLCNLTNDLTSTLPSNKLTNKVFIKNYLVFNFLKNF